MTPPPMVRALSAHLSFAELACKDGAPYPSEWRDRARVLADVFETIRAACGHRPIVIFSAYRTPAHNRAIGGARNSQHLQGRALDLKTPKAFTRAQFVDRVRAAIQATPVRGLGLYPWGVHVDIRPAARLLVWGSGATKDSAIIGGKK